MAPGTEFALDFCAEIGPLQLGVVLVFGLFKSVFLQQKNMDYTSNAENENL